MDRHQPDHVGRFRARRGKRLFRRLGDELSELRDKAAQVDDARIGRAGLLEQLVQIGELALAEKFAEHHGVITGAIERLAEQRGDRDAVLHGAEMRERVGRRSRFARALRPTVAAAAFGEEPGVEAAGGIDEPEQRFIGQCEKRAAQHAGQAHFVGGAGHRTEQVEHIVDFLLSVKRVAADEVVIEARGRGALPRTAARRSARGTGSQCRPA